MSKLERREELAHRLSESINEWFKRTSTTIALLSSAHQHLLEVFRGESDIASVEACEDYLGVKRGSISSKEELIPCIRYDAAIHALLHNKTKTNLTISEYYIYHLKESVTLAWQFVCNDFKSFKNNISNKCATSLLGLTKSQYIRSRVDVHQFHRCHTFKQVYVLLSEFGCFLNNRWQNSVVRPIEGDHQRRPRQDKKILSPTPEMAELFLNERYQDLTIGDNNDSASEGGSLTSKGGSSGDKRKRANKAQAGQLDDSPIEGLDGGCISRQNNPSDSGPDSASDSDQASTEIIPEDEHDRLPPVSPIPDIMENLIVAHHQVGIENVTSYRGLIPMVASAHIMGEDGKLEMTRDDWMTFSNSKPVAKLIFKKLSSAFHLIPGGAPQPLDVISGVSRQGTCSTPDGPIIKVYLQKHPVENRLVTVITFENHLSTEYSGGCRDGINAMRFQQIGHNGSYLRIATSAMPPGRPSPLITFGNQQSTLRYYQATTSTTKIENDVLEMTKYIHSLVDSALNEAIISFKKALVESKSSHIVSSPPGNATVGHILTDATTHQTEHATFAFPMGTHSPLDCPDSTVAQASKNKPYGHHSDTGPIKPCNHDNSQLSYHCSMMRILTHCFAYLKGGLSGVNDGINDGQPVVSIHHGIPACFEGDEDRFCTLLGYFCSSSDNFVNVSDRKEKIFLAFQNHAHMQLWGSQGDIHHYIESEREDAIRIVVSPRLLQLFQQTREMQECRITSDPSKILSQDRHVHLRIIDILDGSNRFILASQTPVTLDNANSTPCNRPPQKSKESKRIVVASGAFQNGDLTADEKSIRQSVIGIPTTISPENIVRSVYSVKQLLPFRASVLFLRKSKQKSQVAMDKVIIGAFPVQSENKGYCLLPPGTVHSQLNNSFDITSNSHNHQVLNSEKMDVVNVQRLQKNSQGLGANLITVLNFTQSKGQVREPLVEWELRGQGGAAILAGSNALDSSNPKATREAPTHYPPSGQDTSSKSANALYELVQSHQCVNVFFKNIYIGLFYAKEASIKAHSKEEALKELAHLKSTLSKLHRIQPGLVPKEVSDDMLRELSGIMAVTISIRMLPVDPNALSMWSDTHVRKSGEIPWNVVELSDEDIVKPEALVDKESVNRFTLLGDNMKFENCFHLITNDPHKLCFMSHSAKEMVGIDAEDDMDPLDEAEASNMCTVNGTMTMMDLTSAAVHSAAITTVKAASEAIIKENSIVPPRFILDDFSLKRNASYHEALKQTNLKAILTRCLHPHIISFDPAAIIANAANSPCSKIQELDHNGAWLYRNGPSFILNVRTEDEAFSIIFRAILSCCLNPPALLQLSRHMQQLNLGHLKEEERLYLPSPCAGEEFRQLKEYILSLKWESRFLHRIFRKGTPFPSAEAFISFLTLIQERGKDIFKEGAHKSIDGSREDSISHITKSLSLNDGGTLSSFLVQVIMRTIETCIHEPFGDVNVVPSGPGGTIGACCLIADLAKSEVTTDNNAWRNSSSVPDKCKLVPSLIVKWYNKWADETLNHSLCQPERHQQIHKTPTDTERTKLAQCEDELLVLGLRWSVELSCLVHIHGIGKKFDSSDAEHMLCMMYCMHQYTLPSRNVPKSNRIDSEKYIPIRNTGGCLAKDMALMHEIVSSSPNVIIAYKRLLLDESYCNRRLADIFRIDFN